MWWIWSDSNHSCVLEVKSTSSFKWTSRETLLCKGRCNRDILISYVHTSALFVHSRHAQWDLPLANVTHAQSMPQNQLKVTVFSDAFSNARASTTSGSSFNIPCNFIVLQKGFVLFSWLLWLCLLFTMSAEQTLAFIEDYRSHCALWDITDKNYTNKMKRNDAYAVLATKYELTVKEPREALMKWIAWIL